VSVAGTGRGVAYLQLAASMALVGVYVALSKPLTLALPVFALAMLRFAIAALAMLPWTLPRPDERPLDRHDRRLLFLQSFFGNFLFSICMLYGMTRSSATAAGVILSTLPATVAVGSRLLLKERLSARALAAVLLAVGGMALLQLSRPGGAPPAASSWAGNALLFASVCCEALYVIIGKRLAVVRSPLRVSAMINLWGLALMLPPGLWQLRHVDLAALAPATWALLVFYALAASLFAVWLWMSGLRTVPAGQAGVFTVALPIATTIVAVALLGEDFMLREAAALALAIGGIVLIALEPAPRLAASFAADRRRP